MKPDWKDAPEWATHLAMDPSGSWMWFADEPVIHDGRFWDRRTRDGVCEWAEFSGWEDTLQERPAEYWEDYDGGA